MVPTQATHILDSRVSSQLGPMRILKCFQSHQHSFAWEMEGVKVSSKKRRAEEKRTEGLSTFLTDLHNFFPFTIQYSLKISKAPTC